MDEYAWKMKWNLGSASEISGKGQKAKILDYYSMIVSDHAVSPGAQMRQPIRGNCKICQRTIRGSHRVKSNFICHLRRCHPDTYDEFEILSGRKSSLVPIPSYDEPVSMVTNYRCNSSVAAPEATDVTIMSQPSTPMDSKPSPSAVAAAVANMSAAAASFIGLPQRRHTSDLLTVFPGVKPEFGMLRNPSMFPGSMSISPPSAATTAAAVRSSNGVVSASLLSSTDKTIQKRKKFIDSLLDFTIGNLLPLEVLKSHEFRKLIAICREQGADVHSWPSIHELKTLIQQRASERRSSTKNVLKGINHLCLSEDLWQSWCDGKTYATISVHYIQEWTYKHALLICKETRQQTPLGAVRVFEQVFGDTKPVFDQVICNLSKIQSLPGFTDCGGSKLSDAYYRQHSYHSCFTYELGNVILQAINDSSQTDVLSLVKKATHLLFIDGMDWGCDVKGAKEWFKQLRLIDIVVNANVAQRLQIARMVAEPDLFVVKEEKDLNTILDVIKPFCEIVERFRIAGSDRMCTGSLVVPYHRLLIQTLAELEVKYPTNSFLACVNDKFVDCTKFVEEGHERPTIYATATILDPRFKLRWCDDKDYEGYRDHLISLAKRVVKEEFSPATSTQITENSGGSSGNSFSVFAKILKLPSESSEDAAVATEVLRYLRESLIGEDRNILIYWDQNEVNFPRLAALAVQYLAIPTSSSDNMELHPSDWPVSSTSHSLCGELLENVVELRSNMRNSSGSVQ